MALWNKVISGFDKDEETVNFGARTLAENNGSLYETSTIATIQSDEEVLNEPNVLTSVEYSRVCVAIDKSITIFEDETCKQILLNVSFGLVITCFSISQDGSFLFVVLSNGTLYCLYLLNKGQVIFTKNITQDENKIIKIFLQTQTDGYINAYLVTKNGILYRLSHFYTKPIQLAAINETKSNDALKILREQIKCEELYKGFTYDEIIYAAAGMINKEISVAMLSSNMLFIWPSEQYNSFKTLGYNYIKVQFFKNHVAMLCLRSDYVLSMMCPQTLLSMVVYSKPASDFVIIENNENNSCEIIVLTKSDINSTTQTLHVLSFPEFQEKFQINVPIIAYLVEIMNPCDEMILYLEGVTEFKCNNKYIDTIRVKTVSETIPEWQLQRLIRREQFDAAEAFARKFNLSTESIYSAKAALALSQFGPWAKQNSNPMKLDALLNIFDQIENVQYVVECCNNALIPDYKQMRRIYLYARSRIMACAIQDNKHLNLLSLINNILHKLETFHMIWGFQKNLETYDENTMQEWIRFSRTNLMEEHKNHLHLGEMEAATLIWTRHLSDVIKYVSVETVKDILETVPDKIEPRTLWPWLSHFIPTLLSFIPNAMNEIIFWSCKRVKSFEQSYRSEWPQIGIDFIKKFIKLLKFQEGHQFQHFSNECLNKDSNLKHLIFVTQAITDIQNLKVNYRLTIPLDFYIGDPMEVTHMLLNKLHPDVIPEFVNTFLKQYMLNNSLQNDCVLSSYIEKTMRNSKSWWSGEEAPWEKKVVVIIDLIYNIETKLLQTLEVLKKASVPWSSTILSLVEKSSNIDHILTIQIRTEHNCVPIKLVLKKYGYERIGMNNKLIYRIIKENRDSMVSDITEITKTDLLLRKKAFSSCINYNLSRGNLNTIMKVLSYLEDDVLLYCCTQIVNYVIANLTLKTMPESHVHYIDILSWVKLHLQELSAKCKKQSHYCCSIIKSISEVQSMYTLKNKFRINITIQEYQFEKEQIIRDYIEKVWEENSNKDEHVYTIYKNIIRLSDLLKYQRVSAIFLLLKYTKHFEVLNYFIRCEEKQLHLMPNECPYIHKICLLVMEHTKVDADMTLKIQNLCCAALCRCSDYDLKSMLHLYIWVNLYQECSNTGFRHGFDSIDTEQEEVSKSNWKLYTIYNDLAIAANEYLLPLLRDVMLIQKLGRAKSKYGVNCKIADEVVQNDNMQNMEGALRELLHKMKTFRVEHNDYCLLKIIKTLYFTLCIISGINHNLLMEIQSVYFYVLMALLKRVITSRTFDLQLSLSCAFMLPNSEACKWISAACKSFQPDCTRHFRITILGYEYHRLLKNKSFLEVFKNYKILHSWAHKLSKYSISYKEILTSNAASKRKILQRIMTHNDDMIPLFQTFCFDFGFDIQDCLLMYLHTVIKIWNPKLYTHNRNGKKELQIAEDEVNELRKKCNTIAENIPDKVALKNHITSISSQINFYHYEIFIILMDIIEDKNVEHRNYFCFLQNYTRTGQPTQIEYDEWMQLNPGDTSLPPIAEWRLPFLPKVELWKLITPELNIKTYEKWLDIAPILKLQPHIICTLAIKGEVTCAWKNEYKTNQWSLNPKNINLLNDIKKCIDRMTGPDALYYGTAALYYVVNHTPPGADQVAAVEECYKYAQLSAQQSMAFEDGMLEKIKFKYLRFSLEHILHTHGLQKQNYLSLIASPHQLIRELYTDESIPQRYRCVIDHRPDINSAVSSIAELFSINVVKLRMELLHEWLQPDAKGVRFNQSVTDTFSVMTNPESNIPCDDNLLRACYILEHGDIELSANFLISIGFDDTNEDYSPEIRYRALYILQTIVDINKLEDLTKHDYQTIRNYMKSLKYIGKLELLGIGYSVNTFETCSKEELVQMLWKTQNYSSHALIIIAQICIDFGIYEYSLWDKTLTKLAKFLMVNDLKKILLQVRSMGAIVNSNGYLLGWETIISEPFRKMDMHPTPEQIENCTEALQLVYSCPVVHMLNFSDIIKYCFQCQQPHLALAFLPFLNENDTKVTLEKIKHSSNIAKVLEDLNNLNLNGVLCVAYCKKIIKDSTIATNTQ